MALRRTFSRTVASGRDTATSRVVLLVVFPMSAEKPTETQSEELVERSFRRKSRKQWTCPAREAVGRTVWKEPGQRPERLLVVQEVVQELVCRRRRALGSPFALSALADVATRTPSDHVFGRTCESSSNPSSMRDVVKVRRLFRCQAGSSVQTAPRLHTRLGSLHCIRHCIRPFRAKQERSKMSWSITACTMHRFE